MNDLGTELHYIIIPNFFFTIFILMYFVQGFLNTYFNIFMSILCIQFLSFFSSDYYITSTSCHIQTVNIAFNNSIMFHARIIAWIT